MFLSFLDAKYYDHKIYRQLENQSFYTKLRGDPTQTFKNEVRDIASFFFQKGDISKNVFEFLKVNYLVTPVIYILPKILYKYNIFIFY